MNHKEIWETYVASWKTQDLEEKKALFSKSISHDFSYHDPLTKTRGWDDLITYMQDFHEQFVDGFFVTTEFISHGNKSVAKWEMRGANDIVLGDGMSYGEYSNEGRLYEMTGFFHVPQQ